MSQSTNKDVSDDEFQDAISNPLTFEDAESIPLTFTDAKSNPVTEKTGEEIIEEITRQQQEFKLADEANTAEGAAGFEEAVESQQIDSDCEEALIDMEKVLTPAEMKLRKEHAERLKLEANELFKNGDAEKAIKIYSEALQICPTTELKDRAVLFSNRAAAKIKIDSKESAISDCTKAIERWPEYVRAILRRAKLYQETDKLDEALADFQLVYKFDPGNHEAREAMIRLPPQIEERNEKMKEEVFGKLKDLGNMFLKPFGLSTSNFDMQKDPSTGSYSINFNQNKS